VGQWGAMSNPVWHDKSTVPVFPDNNGGEAWPWHPVKIHRDKPSGSKNTVNEKKLTFRLLSHRIPTNAVSSSALAGLATTAQT
jgi:hypothetical protein